MHHSHFGTEVSMREKRLLCKTSSGPEAPKSEITTAPASDNELQELIRTFTEEQEGGLKNKIEEFLANDGQVAAEEIVAFKNAVREQISLIPEVRNSKTLAEIDELMKQLPNNYDNLISYAMSAGLLSQAELANIAFRAGQRNASPGTPERGVEGKVSTEILEKRIKDAKKRMKSFESTRVSMLNDFHANMYSVPRHMRRAYYKKVTGAIRNIRNAKGNPVADYWKARKQWEAASKKSYVRHLRELRGDDMVDGPETEAQSYNFKIVDRNTGKSIASYKQWTGDYMGSGLSRDEAIRIIESTNPTSVRGRNAIIEIDGSEYIQPERNERTTPYDGGVIANAPTDAEWRRRWGFGIDPLSRASLDTQRVAARLGINTRESTLTGTDVAFHSGVYSAVGRGRMIMPGSTPSYVILDNPNLRRSRINAQGQSYDAGGQYREYLRGRGLNVPEPGVSRDVPRNWRPGQWANTFGSNLSPEQKRVQGELRNYYTGTNLDQITNGFPDLEQSTDPRISSTYNQIMTALQQSLSKPRADTYGALALARTRLENLRRNKGMLEGNDRVATGTPLREMFFPVFGLNGDAYVMVEYDAVYRGRKEHRKVVIKDPRNWGDGMFTGRGSQDYAAEAGIHVQVDNFSDGSIRGMTLQFSKPGKYLVKGEMVEIKENKAAPVAKADTAKPEKTPAAATPSAEPVETKSPALSVNPPKTNSTTPAKPAAQSLSPSGTPLMDKKAAETAQLKLEWAKFIKDKVTLFKAASTVDERITLADSIINNPSLAKIPADDADVFISALKKDFKNLNGEDVSRAGRLNRLIEELKFWALPKLAVKQQSTTEKSESKDSLQRLAALLKLKEIRTYVPAITEYWNTHPSTKEVNREATKISEGMSAEAVNGLSKTFPILTADEVDTFLRVETMTEEEMTAKDAADLAAVLIKMNDYATWVEFPLDQTPPLPPDVIEQVIKDWRMKLPTIVKEYANAPSYNEKERILGYLQSSRLKIPVSIAQTCIDLIDADIKKNKIFSEDEIKTLQKFRSSLVQRLPKSVTTPEATSKGTASKSANPDVPAPASTPASAPAKLGNEKTAESVAKVSADMEKMTALVDEIRKIGEGLPREGVERNYVLWAVKFYTESSGNNLNEFGYTAANKTGLDVYLSLMKDHPELCVFEEKTASQLGIKFYSLKASPEKILPVLKEEILKFIKNSKHVETADTPTPVLTELLEFVKNNTQERISQFMGTATEDEMRKELKLVDAFLAALPEETVIYKSERTKLSAHKDMIERKLPKLEAAKREAAKRETAKREAATPETLPDHRAEFDKAVETALTQYKTATTIPKKIEILTTMLKAVEKHKGEFTMIPKTGTPLIDIILNDTRDVHEGDPDDELLLLLLDIYDYRDFFTSIPEGELAERMKQVKTIKYATNIYAKFAGMSFERMQKEIKKMPAFAPEQYTDMDQEMSNNATWALNSLMDQVKNGIDTMDWNSIPTLMPYSTRTPAFLQTIQKMQELEWALHTAFNKNKAHETFYAQFSVRFRCIEELVSKINERIGDLRSAAQPEAKVEKETASVPTPAPEKLSNGRVEFDETVNTAFAQYKKLTNIPDKIKLLKQMLNAIRKRKGEFYMEKNTRNEFFDLAAISDATKELQESSPDQYDQMISLLLEMNEYWDTTNVPAGSLARRMENVQTKDESLKIYAGFAYLSFDRMKTEVTMMPSLAVDENADEQKKQGAEALNAFMDQVKKGIPQMDWTNAATLKPYSTEDAEILAKLAEMRSIFEQLKTSSPKEEAFYAQFNVRYSCIAKFIFKASEHVRDLQDAESESKEKKDPLLEELDTFDPDSKQPAKNPSLDEDLDKF